MSFNLSDTSTRVEFSKQMCQDFGFESLEQKSRLWDHKCVNDVGEVLVIRGDCWVLYHPRDPEDDVIAEGESPAGLVEFLQIRAGVTV